VNLGVFLERLLALLYSLLQFVQCAIIITTMWQAQEKI